MVLEPQLVTTRRWLYEAVGVITAGGWGVQKHHPRVTFLKTNMLFFSSILKNNYKFENKIVIHVTWENVWGREA